MDHDGVVKGLLKVFFTDFLEAFVPKLHAQLGPGPIEFLDKELIRRTADRITRRFVDLLAKVHLSSNPGLILVHVEHQAQRRKDMAWRMLQYTIWLQEQFRVPVYPILLCSYARPLTPEPSRYCMVVLGEQVIDFRLSVIQLNRLRWQSFCERPNPAATALMVRMQVKPEDRVRLKLQILRLISRMRLDRKKMDLLAGFVDQYLVLQREERVAFEQELDKIGSRKQKGRIMRLMTQWEREGWVKGKAQGMAKGRAKGRVEGRKEEAQAVVLRLIQRRFGRMPAAVRTRIGELELERLEALAEALLDFKKWADLIKWLRQSNRHLRLARRAD